MKFYKKLLAGALALAFALPVGAGAAETKNYHDLTPVGNDFYWLGGDQHCISFKENGKYGVKTLSGTVILPAEYSMIGGWGSTEERMQIVKNGLYGMADTGGHILMEPKWKHLTIGEDSVTLQTQDDKFGFADLDGRIFLEPQYDDAEVFEDGRVLVGKDLKYTYIDKTGTPLVPWQDYELSTWDGVYFSDGRYRNATDRVIDRTGKAIIENMYDGKVEFFGGRVGVAEKDGKAGLIDPQGKAILPFEYDYIIDRHRNFLPDGTLLIASKNGRISFYDLNGKQIGGRDWEKTDSGIGATIGRMLVIRENGKYGLMDLSGNIVREPRYDSLYSDPRTDTDSFFVFDGQLAGLMSADGKLLTEPCWLFDQYPNRWSNDGFCSVRCNRTAALISSKGELVIAPREFDDIVTLGDGYIQVANEEENDVWRYYLARINDTIVPLDNALLSAAAHGSDPKVQYLVDRGILRGDENGDLNLGGRVTRAEFVTLLSRAESWNLSGVQPGTFTDVPEKHWAAREIEKAVEFGVVNGVGGGKFDPDGPITNEQAMMILVRRAGYAAQAEELDKQYPDASYHRGYFSVAGQIGLRASAGDFHITEPAPRDLICQFLYDYLHLDTDLSIGM
ncbi:WG repeat-containing protein [Intestinibacillus massiliensis]|uniref:WG repeat-containing protein n=1 Tax=Intestinibacillus massiliensis TaxID=1871029 RepID=UPI000B34D492|nr:WG repeat-containing protein [Intestinibacillus massiliensis]